jgi:hypothetical protein
MTQTKIGFSAMSAHHILGIAYPSAWTTSQKVRFAMDQAGRGRLTGEVELDETYVGGEEHGSGGRSRAKKEAVGVACERKSDRAMGRTRLARLPSASALAIADFIEHNIEPGSVLLSDNWASCGPALDELSARGLHYDHEVTTLRTSGRTASEVHPHVHRVAALLERWLLGTHQGAVAGPHLDELVFRFNRRRSANRGLLFWRLACALVDAQAVSGKELRARARDQQLADDAHAEAVKAWTTKRHRQQAALN